MAQVLIRDIDETTVSQLKERARSNHRSFEAELRLILEQAAQRSMHSSAAELEKIRAMFAGRTFSDSVELLREDRER
ncbi:MAG: Arc family DNA-binding protein [Capsulimonas sp.]|uniref:FitA-like ribbon-helix-helix domain-containing protein n=1 Tax=Capsulimonas sp. TaxID=2494211 RepID=UPI00326539C9